MNVIAYNPQKGRLETITVHFTEATTTWFAGMARPENVTMITDLDGALLITRDDRGYPVIIYDVSRKGINYSREKAGELFNQALLQN